MYRALCAVLFNFAQSGHPGGSVSSGHIVTGLLFDGMDYDMGDPNRTDQDLLSYSAGHKALGLYAMWALRDEITRIARPDLLPEAMTSDHAFYDTGGDESLLQARMKAMMDSCVNFIDFESIDVIPMSEYLLKPLD